MNLRPIGNRVLIRPEAQAQTTDSGLILAEHRKPEQTGTVVAVGPCAHPLKAEAEACADAIVNVPGVFDTVTCKTEQRIQDAADLLRDLVRKEPVVKPGDYVVFSWTAGQEVWVEDGDDRYLMMTEDDIMAVVEGLEA